MTATSIDFRSITEQARAALDAKQLFASFRQAATSPGIVPIREASMSGLGTDLTLVLITSGPSNRPAPRLWMISLMSRLFCQMIL